MDPAPTEIYTLSLHDALPISRVVTLGGALTRLELDVVLDGEGSCRSPARRSTSWRAPSATARCRSEEHTSELQSQSNLVCRLLLEKKKEQPFDSLVLLDLSVV